MNVPRMTMRDHITPYKEIWTIQDSRGYVVWRRGTGKTVELLHIVAYGHREGKGTSLFRQMLSEVTDCATIYGFARSGVDYISGFYKSLGFELKTLPHLYEDGNGLIFHQTLTILREFADETNK